MLSTTSKMQQPNITEDQKLSYQRVRVEGSPELTVCIITYNHEKYIRQCLEGVMIQKTDFPFDVVIGEDCSTDGTRSVIREFETRYPRIIKPLYHKSNVGSARNNYEYCFPLIKSKYIAICDGDDYWTDPYKLQKQYDFLEQHPECALCFHRSNSVDQDDNIIKLDKPVDDVIFYSWKDIFHTSIPTLTVVFRNKIKSVPPQMLEAKSGDTFLFGMLSSFGGAADLGFQGAHYRIHQGGSFSGKSKLNRYRQTIQTRKLMLRSSQFNSLQKSELKKEIRKRKVLYVKHFLKKKELINSLKILLT